MQSLNETNSFRSLKDIAGGAQGPFMNAENGNTVLNQLTTGVPSVCNVTYGEDKHDGSIATNTMLNGASQLYGFPVSYAPSVLRFEAEAKNSGYPGAVDVFVSGTLYNP